MAIQLDLMTRIANYGIDHNVPPAIAWQLAAQVHTNRIDDMFAHQRHNRDLVFAQQNHELATAHAVTDRALELDHGRTRIVAVSWDLSPADALPGIDGGIPVDGVLIQLLDEAGEAFERWLSWEELGESFINNGRGWVEFKVVMPDA